MSIELAYPEFGCTHEFPEDWVFGGAVGADPRADARWLPTTYEYLDRNMNRVHITQTPLCDHQAVRTQRATVDNYFPDHKVRYIIATRPDGKPEMVYADIEGAVDVG